MTAPTSAPARTDGSPRAAVALAAAAWGLALCSFVLLLGARPPVDEELLFYVVDVAVAVVYGTVGAVVLWRLRHPVAWLLALAALGGGVAGFGFAYGALAAAVGGLPAEAGMARLSSIGWLPGTFALFLVVPWLVREGRSADETERADGPHGPVAGHPRGERRGDPTERRLSRVGLVVGALLATALTVVAVVPTTETAYLVQQVCIGVAVVVGLLASWAALRRGRAVPPGERSGYRWLALGTTVIALSFVPFAAPVLFAVLPVASVPLLHLVSQVVFPAAVLVVVLRRRLWGLDLAVSRAVLAGGLGLGLVVAYVVVAWLVGALVPGRGLAPVVAAAVVVAAVQPSRLWLRRRIDRLVYGDASDPAEAVRRLGAHLRSAAGTDDLLAGLVDGLGAALRLDAVALVVDGEVVHARGRQQQDPLVVPLEHRGAVVGRLLVTPPGGERLDSRTRVALDELAGVVAAGVALTAATRDLEVARERVTSARMTERRLIRRELHDGLGPSLAGLRLGLAGARNLLGSDPAAAAQVLATLQQELDERVQDVRTLSRDLLPPVLDELGLEAAVSELASRHAGAGFDVRADVVLPGEPAPALAGAAYGIVAEAVTNAVRHSGAPGCAVEVRRHGDDLLLRVSDGGRGAAADAPVGVGTSSMRERAEEAGGSLRVHAPSTGSGTVVEAVLPWRA